MNTKTAITTLTIAMALVVGLVATTVQAAATHKKNYWYTGTKFGWSKYHDTSYNGNGYLNDNGIKYNNNQFGAGAILGYQINPCLGLELGYEWLGRLPKNGSSVNGFFQAYGMQMSTKINYPITKKMDIYTRLGGIVWRANSNQNNLVWGHISDHQTGISPLGAVGLEYALSKKVTTRLDYQWINQIGHNNSVGLNTDNGMFGIGITYHFNHNNTILRLPAIKKNMVETKHFTLNSEVLFSFNNAILTSEGKYELNKLFSQIRLMDPTDSTTIVIGYTDHIGSEYYNQKLSEKRAQVVADYLISKGILANKILVYGRGKHNSITGNTCNLIQNRDALIQCLSRDRRVIIEVEGIKKVINNTTSQLR
ncbi:MAG: porin OmpA [Candidatus Dasytiphilus stammeri]